MRWKSYGHLTSLVSGDRTRTGRVKCSLFSLQFSFLLSKLSSGTHGLSSCLRTHNWQDTRNEPKHVVLAYIRDPGNFESTIKTTIWRARILKPESSHWTFFLGRGKRRFRPLRLYLIKLIDLIYLFPDVSRTDLPPVTCCIALVIV